MASMDITLAERGQIVIPKAARDAIGIKPGARLRLRIDGGRLVIEKIVQLDLSPWVGQAVDDGLTSEQALTELRGRPVPWHAPEPAPAKAAPAKSAPAKSAPAKSAPAKGRSRRV